MSSKILSAAKIYAKFIAGNHEGHSPLYVAREMCKNKEKVTKIYNFYSYSILKSSNFLKKRWC